MKAGRSPALTAKSPCIPRRRRSSTNSRGCASRRHPPHTTWELASRIRRACDSDLYQPAGRATPSAESESAKASTTLQLRGAPGNSVATAAPRLRPTNPRAQRLPAAGGFATPEPEDWFPGPSATAVVETWTINGFGASSRMSMSRANAPDSPFPHQPSCGEPRLVGTPDRESHAIEKRREAPVRVERPAEHAADRASCKSLRR